LIQKKVQHQKGLKRRRRKEKYFFLNLFRFLGAIISYSESELEIVFWASSSISLSLEIKSTGNFEMILT